MEHPLETHRADAFDPTGDHHLDDRMEPILIFGIAALAVVGLLAEMIFTH